MTDRQAAEGDRPKEKRERPPEKPGLRVRQVAQKLLSAVVDARTPLDGLTDDQHGHPQYRALEPRDRALVRAILMVALRHRGDIEAIIKRFLDRPLPAGADALLALLHVALAQILILDVPDHSAADLAVEAAKQDPRLRKFANLVNALTRRAVRQKERLQAAMAEKPVRAPDWYRERLEAQYGADAMRRVFDIHRLEAPVDLTLRDAATASELAALMGATVLPTGSIRLPASHGDITALPGFSEGQWWVQDAAAALPVRLLGDIAGKRAIDLCAAPGGKTAQMLAAGANVTALDLSANRLKRLAANLERLQLSERCTPVVANLLEFVDESGFDAVLLDAPCSSTGTVRRHPDVPWTKTPGDIEKLAGLQARMLERAAELLAPGGVLVFSNCSIDKAEGESVVAAFDAHAAGLVPDPVRIEELPGLPEALTAEGHVRTLPFHLDMGNEAASGLDGFFAARWRRPHA